MIAQHQQIDRDLRQFLDEIRTVPPGLPHQLARVLGYVHDNLFDPALNVKVVKAQCQCHDNNVTLRFHSALGTGLREYIERLRLTAADRLLRDSRYPIYVVAMAVGYTYPETFCRAFQRQFGCQPSCRRGASPPETGPEKSSRQ
jgi:AraC-like DNA-binding protein